MASFWVWTLGVLINNRKEFRRTARGCRGLGDFSLSSLSLSLLSLYCLSLYRLSLYRLSLSLLSLDCIPSLSCLPTVSLRLSLLSHYRLPTSSLY